MVMLPRHDDIEGVYDDVSDAQRDIDSELNAIFSEFGGDPGIDEFEIIVYSLVKGELVYRFRCLPAELPILDRLRDEFGGGQFAVHVRRNKKYYKKYKCVVAPPTDAQRRHYRDSHSDAVQSGDNAVIAAINAGFARLFSMQQTQAQAPSMPVLDPIALQSSMLQNMLAMKEILGLGGEKVNPFDQMKSLIEVQKGIMELSGDGGGDSNMTDVLLKVVGMLPDIASLQAQQPKQQTQTPTIGTKPAMDKPQMQNNFAGQLMLLTRMAKKNANPMTYAEAILDNTPAEKLGELLSFISSAQAMDEIKKIYPPAGEYPGWFSELAQCIVDLVNQSPGGIDTTQPIGQYVPTTPSGKNN